MQTRPYFNPRVHTNARRNFNLLPQMCTVPCVLEEPESPRHLSEREALQMSDAWAASS